MFRFLYMQIGAFKPDNASLPLKLPNFMKRAYKKYLS